MKTTAIKGKPGIRVKENGKYIVFKSIAGNRVTKEFTDLLEAQEWKKSKSSVDLRVNGKDPSLSGQGEGRNEIYFRDVLAQYYKEGMNGLTEYTRHKKTLRMRNFLPNLLGVKMSELNGRVITRHLNDMKLIREAGSKRCNFDKELKDLSSIFNWYDREVTSFHNPIKRNHYKDGHVKNIRKKKKDLPIEFVKHFLGCLEEPFKSLATIQFILGLRIGEAAALNTHTVNFKTRKIDISESIVWLKGKPIHEYATKTNADLEKAITPQVEEILLRLNDQRPKGCIFFFHRKGKPLRYQMIREKFNEGMVRAGLDNYSGTHILRHSFATHVRGLADLDTVQAALGHTSARQTEKYARLDADQRVTGVVVKIENYLRGVQPQCNQVEERVI